MVGDGVTFPVRIVISAEAAIQGGNAGYLLSLFIRLHPQNLKATANLWLWSLRDFVILAVAALLSVLALVQLHIFLPAVAVLCYGFLTIRMDDTTVMDFMPYAVRYLIYTINPLEPKAWTDSVEDIDATTPEAFKKVTRLSQHIAFLKDFFRSYKDFTDSQIDTIEILLSKLYARFGITDTTDYSVKKPSDFPIMEDFYKLCEEEFMAYDKQRKYLYTEETLQEVCLGIHSMCVGSESKYFNGHTNITDSNFLVFGVKGLMDTNRRKKDCMLFNILSFMSNELLGKGSTAASVDELYLFLSNMTTIEYLRNCMKRVRKKDSSVILASQNIEDFLIPSIREFTKPLFSIPTHQFLFNAGQINPKEYMDALQVEPSEFELIKYPERGTCLYRCGNERYLLQVIAPEYKAAIFGKAGGR